MKFIAMRNANIDSGNYNESIGGNYNDNRKNYELKIYGCLMIVNKVDKGLIQLDLQSYHELLSQMEKSANYTSSREIKKLNDFEKNTGIDLKSILQKVKNKDLNNLTDEELVVQIDPQGLQEPILIPSNNLDKEKNLQMSQNLSYQQLKESLSKRDYTLLIDKSASMIIKDQLGNRSRWDAIKESTLGLAALIHDYDSDGIKIYLFSSRFDSYDNVDEQKVVEIFKKNKPLGTTNLAAALDDALNDYFNRKQQGKVKEKGEIFLVVTDGLPDNGEKVKEVIMKATRKVEHETEIGISFLLVGSDPDATKFLTSLDNNWKDFEAKYDICDFLNLKDFNLGNVTPEQLLINALND